VRLGYDHLVSIAEPLNLSDGTNVNHTLVKDGWGWWYWKYAPYPRRILPIPPASAVFDQCVIDVRAIGQVIGSAIDTRWS
jgi:hypothetical protein